MCPCSRSRYSSSQVEMTTYRLCFWLPTVTSCTTKDISVFTQSARVSLQISTMRIIPVVSQALKLWQANDRGSISLSPIVKRLSSFQGKNHRLYPLISIIVTFASFSSLLSFARPRRNSVRIKARAKSKLVARSRAYKSVDRSASWCGEVYTVGSHLLWLVTAREITGLVYTDCLIRVIG